MLRQIMGDVRCSSGAKQPRQVRITPIRIQPFWLVREFSVALLYIAAVTHATSKSLKHYNQANQFGHSCQRVLRSGDWENGRVWLGRMESQQTFP